ncbi:unnamed protein product [Cuscuta campestris]|uniref:Flowering time control protein FCA n=1 Tax=Cuscuta campestris TaxID=132261 RepID=A0A484NNV5_9ASTE|nr:unnamed protein product [Cuscuta campestris]
MDTRSNGELPCHPDFHRNYKTTAPSQHSDESIAHNNANHGGRFPGDANQHRQRCHQKPPSEHHDNHSEDRLHQNTRLEPNESVNGAATRNFGHSPHTSGRKRPLPSSQPPLFPDVLEGGGFVKLYVGGVPRTTTEEDIQHIFGEYGHILEIILLKDKKIDQKQVSCFVKYRALDDADRAILALHDRYTIPGAECPLRVRYAEGERERLGNFGEHLHKLYVGGMNRQTSKREIDELFSRYGIIESIFFVRDRDDQKQHRGCAFVQFSRRDMAVAAINALQGTYTMRGCDHPLIVRFADPKKPRSADSRAPSCIHQHFGGPMPLNPSSPKQQTVLNTCAALEQAFPSTTASANKSPSDADCEWSEHICPDGYPYYYNCVTCESRWERPEEYAHYEKLEMFEEQQNEQFATQAVSQGLEMDVQRQLSTNESWKLSSSTRVGAHMNASPRVPPACV